MKMKRRIIKPLFASFIFTALLIGAFACSTNDDYLDESEVRRMIEEALRDNNQQTGDYLNEMEVKRLIEEAVANNMIITEWNIENFTVNSTEWEWNPDFRRWEAEKQLEFIDEFIYEEGAVIGYVFLGEQNVNEVQVQLPYLKSYLITDDDDGEIMFTETTGYEYSFLTNKVTFFIEPSDGFEDPEAKVTRNFRIVMIW
jgi:hypothetical protein